MKSEIYDRFCRYVKIDTQSDEESESFPSTEKQKDLGRILHSELLEMGVLSEFDEEYGYVYAKIEATKGREDEAKLAFIAHMDTSPETSGRDVKPRLIENYDGNDLLLNEALDICLKVENYPEIAAYKGQDIIVTDGTTLLGADDKAGVTEIMEMVKAIVNNPEMSHGPIRICFTPDEEVGAGVDYIDLERLDADYAYTVDGGGIGELEYENFNAAAARVIFKGVTVHPGEAKNKMINASLLAMEFESLLPAREKPEYTEGYEGFFYLTDMTGGTEEAALNYIIRDHDREKFEIKKKVFCDAADEIMKRHPGCTVTTILKDQYYNMKEKIDPDNMFLIEKAKTAMLELGITPKIMPIRGGTDGARLSFMGLPCPNICTGGHNYHGRYEYACLDSMEKITNLLIKLALGETN